MVVGFAGLLDLGYVAFFLFGAYSAAWLMSTSRSTFAEQVDFHFLDAAAPTSPASTSSFWLV